MEDEARKKTLYCYERNSRGNSGEGLEEEGSCRQNLNLLRDDFSGYAQHVVGMWTVKTILIRSQMEMRTILLKLVGRPFLL